jgi:TM2 domain-containing membrane protein YozV
MARPSEIQPSDYERGYRVDKSTLLLLTLVFGWLGSHKFYTRQDTLGAIYYTAALVGIILTLYFPIWVALPLFRDTRFSFTLNIHVGLWLLLNQSP